MTAYGAKWRTLWIPPGPEGIWATLHAMRTVALQQSRNPLVEETAQQLNPALRSFSHCHHAASDTQQTWLFEVGSWHRQGVRPPGWSAMAVLRLSVGARLAVCSRERDSVVVGRDPNCDLLVESREASRLHCTIHHSEGHFSVRDHSNNGTYVRG